MERRQIPRGGITRRRLLTRAAVGGAGIAVALGAGGYVTTRMLGTGATPAPAMNGFTIVQLSDTHIGFDTDGVNPDAAGTLRQLVAHINALPQPPALVVHTGDVTHLSKPEQFDTAQQILKTIKAERIIYLPGEHDTINDKGAAFRERFIGTTRDRDYFSLDLNGAHIIGLSNIGIEDKFGVLGATQLAWLKSDLARVHRETPVLVFAHVPLFPVYPPWGWTTQDSAQAIELLEPFASVTVLNGHIHQSLSHTIGNIRFHVSMSSAFPQHHPGDGSSGAYKLPADELPHLLGFQTTMVVPDAPELPVFDTTLASPVTPQQ